MKRSRVKEKLRGACGEEMAACFLMVHQMGITPYSYHSESRTVVFDTQTKRIQHYKATMFWTTFITFGFATAFYALNLDHFQDNEHKIFNGLDHFGHQAFAVFALAGLAAAIAAAASVSHYGADRLTCAKDRSEYAIQLQVQGGDAQVDMTEETGLMGQDTEGASVFRFGACHPLNLIYPASPSKTFAWIGFLAFSAFVIGSVINPALFNEIAGDSPLVNGTFTNCTPTNTNVTNPACVAEIGHIGAVATLGALSALALGGIATLFHYAGAKVQEYREQRLSNDFINPGLY